MLIEVSKLAKSFGRKTVLSNINLRVKEAQSYAIIGGSGSGKSVLIKSISGILLPDSKSKVIIDGEDVTSIPIRKRAKFLEKFGMLFQGSALFDSLQIWENICFFLLNKKNMSRYECQKKAQEVLEKVDLDPSVYSLFPNELSGGMQKRVGLARAIAHDPKIIFLDEPTSGLDPITANSIGKLIANLSKTMKATTVTITHDMHCVKQIADSVAMLKDGKLVWDSTLKEFLNSKDKYVRTFIDSSA